jgi:hypothetical protein
MGEGGAAMPGNSIKIGRDVSGSVVVQGEGNAVKAPIHYMPNPGAALDRADLTKALAEIRQALEKLDTADRGKINRAMEDAEEEARKASPDKAEIGSSLERAFNYAKKGAEIARVAEGLQAPLKSVADWVGTAVPAAARLFGLI